MNGRPIGFDSRRAALQFWLFAAATFLYSLSTTMLALLSVIFKDAGLDERQIGIVLSASAIPMIIATLCSGALIGRIGAIPTAILGQIVVLATFIGLQFADHSFYGAVCCRIVQGVGLGLVVPAAMVFAKSRLNQERFVYYFGIYSSMMPLPNMFGPFIAELYLQRFGVAGFFFVAGIPILLGAVMAAAIGGGGGWTPKSSASLGYLKLLTSRELRLPNVSALIFGLIGGFAPSFLALLLAQRGVSVSYFFSTYTICMFGSRLLVFGRVQSLPREVIVAGGIGLGSIGYALLIFAHGPAATVLAGILFGLGQSVNYPTLSIWFSERFPPEDRGRPVALFNTIYNLGVFLTPLFGGYVIAETGAEWLLAMLSLLGFGLLGFIGLRFAVRSSRGAAVAGD
ncbi:MAG TPA: MFS transporter [Candidatus Cybelea sp.]|nr:MFS transporter [Candidatus Cybelea sp.]